VRVCLVSAPTLSQFEDLARLGEDTVQRMPLGLLTLAGVLERAELRPELADLDSSYAAWLASSGRRGGFVRHVAEDLARRGADVYGFGTICSSYPLTLRIATTLKELDPGCRIVLGGPQATATADETVAAFPAVDAVVRGEADAVFPALLDALASSSDLAAVPGLTYRSGGGVVHTRDAPLIDDLDALPSPAYHLYPALRRAESVPLEVGRGCPFSCTFCSTSAFFGRRFRLKSPARIVEEMRTLLRTYGLDCFELVHDNFTVDRSRVVAFCDALASCGEGFSWSCSSRTDSLDDDLLEQMRSAGCTGVFFGIESGSPTIQRAIGKRLDLAAARTRLRRIDRRGIPATVAFITGFPEETPEDLRDTVELLVDSLRFDRLEPQLTLLSPLAGTAIHERHRHELVRDAIVSDMAFQGEEQDRADDALIDRYPDIFSTFYSVPTRWLDRPELHELRGFLTATTFDLRWLLLAAARVSGGGLPAFRAFRTWRAARSAWQSPGAIAAYYRGAAFRADFVRFVSEDLASRHVAAGHALRAVASYSASLEPRPPAPGAPSLGGTAPVRGADVRVARIGCDGAALIRCLRRGGDLSRVPRRDSTLVSRRRRGRREILHLSEAAADLLELCDGTRDARAVTRAFRELHRHVAGVRAEVACAVGLDSLRRRGLLAPLARADGAASSRRARPPASRGAPSGPPARADRRPRPSSARAGGRAPPAPRRGVRAGRASAP
jgi:radical SAM superfamily enzyme YgiQ (UPF0313 family)